MTYRAPSTKQKEKTRLHTTDKQRKGLNSVLLRTGHLILGFACRENFKLLRKMPKDDKGKNSTPKCFLSPIKRKIEEINVVLFKSEIG